MKSQLLSTIAIYLPLLICGLVTNEIATIEVSTKSAINLGLLGLMSPLLVNLPVIKKK